MSEPIGITLQPGGRTVYPEDLVHAAANLDDGNHERHLAHGIALMVAKLAEARRDDLDALVRRVEVLEMSAAAKEADAGPATDPAATLAQTEIAAEREAERAFAKRCIHRLEIRASGLLTGAPNNAAAVDRKIQAQALRDAANLLREEALL